MLLLVSSATHLKELRREVYTVRIAPWNFEVPRPCGTGRNYHRVVLSMDFLGVDINSDMSTITNVTPSASIRSIRRCTTDLECRT